MLIIIAYIVPLLIALVVAFPVVVSFFKLVISLRRLDEEKREQKITQWFRSLDKPKSDRPLSPSLQPRPFVLYHMWIALKYLTFSYFLPISVLRMTLLSRFGNHFLRRLPMEFYFQWDLLFLGLGFYFAYEHKIVLAMTVSVLVGLTAIYGMGIYFEKEQSSLKVLVMPFHKLHIWHIVQHGATLVGSFAVIYYSLDRIIPEAFQSNLTVLDSIYFSLMTFTTVGYGDISPMSFSAKLVSVIEICFSFVFVIIFLSVFIQIWLKRQTEGNKS
ncbi:MAG: potassium channel family protein [Candidatus Hodarchaeota archaeon]